LRILDEYQRYFKYKMNLVDNMRQLLRASLKHLKCILTDHVVSKEDEEELFTSPAGYLRTTCLRCLYPILLRKDPADKDNNHYMLMEE